MKASDIEPYFVLHPLPDVGSVGDRHGHHKSHDWKKRHDELKREHDAKMRKLAEEFGCLKFVAYDISRMDFGSAKMRCELHLPKVAKILGREYFDFFKEAAI